MCTARSCHTFALSLQNQIARAWTAEGGGRRRRLRLALTARKCASVFCVDFALPSVAVKNFQKSNPTAHLNPMGRLYPPIGTGWTHYIIIILDIHLRISYFIFYYNVSFRTRNSTVIDYFQPNPDDLIIFYCFTLTISDTEIANLRAVEGDDLMESPTVSNESYLNDDL